jgi:hypothetical protein
MGLRSQGSLLLEEMDPRLWGNHGFVGKWAQVLKKPLGANGYLSFIGCNFLSSFHSICNLSFIQCKRFYINFSSIFCNIFFNFSLSNVAYCRRKFTKWMNYRALFTQFSLNNLVMGNTSPPSWGKL